MYDAIIVGGSFAGLAVASRLRGKVLLIDRKAIGTRQTSACGTLLSVPLKLGALESVLQVYHRGYIHTASRTLEYDLPYAFCAFDYARFCQALLSRLDVDVLQASVLGLAGDRMITDHGEFEARCLVDASGWRAALASSVETDFVNRRAASFGIETVVEYQAEGLHFWVDPELVNRGVTWLFPCGSRSRVGIGSYDGRTDLKDRLAGFVESFGCKAGNLHGGFFPWRLRSPTVGMVFLVGDAAGQCLPLTGEGIRPAIFFGQQCGDIIQQVIDERIDLREGLRRYNAMVAPFRRVYAIAEQAQHRLIALPNAWLTRFSALIGRRSACHYLLRRYDRLFPLATFNNEAEPNAATMPAAGDLENHVGRNCDRRGR